MEFIDDVIGGVGGVGVIDVVDVVDVIEVHGINTHSFSFGCGDIQSMCASINCPLLNALPQFPITILYIIIFYTHSK